MVRFRSTIHIDRKTKSFWQKDYVLCLVEPERISLLWAVKTQGRLILNITNKNRPIWIEKLTSLKKARKMLERNRQHKVIFLKDNAPSHTAKPIHDTLAARSWKVLLHAAYSPDLAPPNYHLFASMGHAFTEQGFGSYKYVKKWPDEWFAVKGQDFYSRGIHKLLERWRKYITNDGAYFE